MEQSKELTEEITKIAKIFNDFTPEVKPTTFQYVGDNIELVTDKFKLLISPHGEILHRSVQQKIDPMQRLKSLISYSSDELDFLKEHAGQYPIKTNDGAKSLEDQQSEMLELLLGESFEEIEQAKLYTQTIESMSDDLREYVEGFNKVFDENGKKIGLIQKEAEKAAEECASQSAARIQTARIMDKIGNISDSGDHEGALALARNYLLTVSDFEVSSDNQIDQMAAHLVRHASVAAKAAIEKKAREDEVEQHEEDGIEPPYMVIDQDGQIFLPVPSNEPTMGPQPPIAKPHDGKPSYDSGQIDQSIIQPIDSFVSLALGVATGSTPVGLAAFGGMTAFRAASNYIAKRSAKKAVNFIVKGKLQDEYNKEKNRQKSYRPR